MTDEAMLLRMEVSPEELAAMRAAGPPRDYEGLSATQPLVTLVEALAKRTDRSYIQIQRSDLSITLAKRGASER